MTAKKFPAVHVDRLRKMANDICKEEESLQRLHGDRWPGSRRASRMIDLRSIQAILSCIEKAEAS